MFNEDDDNSVNPDSNIGYDTLRFVPSVTKGVPEPASLTLLAIGFALAVLLHAADFSIRPTPAWVEPAAVDLRVDVPRSHVRYGVYAILIDHQVRGTTDYHRTVRKMLSASGVIELRVGTHRCNRQQ